MKGNNYSIVVNDSIYPVLSEMDADDWITRLKIMALAFIFHGLFMAIFYFILEVIFSKDEKVPFRNKMLATFQAPRCAYSFFAVSGAIFTLLVPTNMSGDIVTGKSVIGVIIVAFTTGFHVTDTITILIGHFVLDLKNTLFVFHHLLMLVLYTGILVTDTGYYIGCVFLLAEIPIPFITVKLLSLGLRTNFARTLLGKVNDFLIVHCFHLRNAFDVFLVCQIFINRQAIYERMPLPMTLVVLSFMSIMSAILVPYWIYFFTEMCLPHHLTVAGGNPQPAEKQKKQE